MQFLSKFLLCGILELSIFRIFSRYIGNDFLRCQEIFSSQRVVLYYDSLKKREFIIMSLYVVYMAMAHLFTWLMDAEKT